MAKYFFGGITGTTGATSSWSAAMPVSFTGSTSGTTTLTTVGNPSLVAGMTVRNAAGASLGTISSGSGNSWILSAASTYASQSMTAATVGVTPVSTDSIYFTEPYAQTITVSNFLTCIDMIVSSSFPIIFTGTGGFTLSGSLNLNSNTTWSATGLITFNATTPQIIYTRGTILTANILFNGLGGTWQLQDSLTLSPTQTITLTQGTIDLNNYTLTSGFFASSNASVRGIKFGTSGTGKITLNGASGGLWNSGIFTNFTVTDTPVINISSTASSATSITVTTGTQTETNSLSYYFTSGSYALTFLNSSSNTVKSIGFTGFTGSWVGTNNITLFGDLIVSSTSSSMTWGSSPNIITFGATSGTWNIDTNGKPIDQTFTFNGAGGTWKLLSNFIGGTSTIASTRTTTLTAGTLNLNNFTYTTGVFSSNNTNTRNITFGSTGNITLVSTTNSVTLWNTPTITGFSVTGTPTVNVSNTNGIGYTAVINSGTMDETTQAVSFNFTTGQYTLTLTAGTTKRDLKFTGFTGAVNNSAQTIYGDLVATSGVSIATGATWTLGGAATHNINVAAAATLPNLVFNSTGTFVLQGDFTTIASKFTYISGNINLNNYSFNIDKLDLATTSTGGSWTLAGGSTGKFNISGTSGTVFWTTSAITTLIDNGVSIYLTSNVSGQARNLITGMNGFDNGYGPSLYFVNNLTGTVTLSGVFGNIDTTGFNGTLTTSGTDTIILCGNLYIASTTLFSPSAANIQLYGKLQQYTIGSTLESITLGSLQLMGGNYKLNSNITSPYYRGFQSKGLNGALDLNGKTLTTSSYYSLGSGNDVITMSGGKIIITGYDSGTLNPSVWDVSNGNSLSFSDSGVVTFTSASTKSISNGGDFAITAKLPTINQGGSGNLIIDSKCTCNDVTATVVPSTIAVSYYGLTTTNFSLSGTASGQVTLNSISSGSQAAISKASGIVNASYLTIKDIIATGGAIWNAYTTKGNIDDGNNTGWNFIALYKGIKTRLQAYLGIKTDAQLYKGTKTIGWL